MISKPPSNDNIKAEVMKMILTNIETVPGMNIVAQYGLVTGSTVRAKNAIKDFGAGLKNMIKVFKV